MSCAILSNLCCLLVLIAILNIDPSSAAYGGGACGAIPAAAPGASTKCTGTANGFCLIETIDFTNKVTTGVCMCHPGYSGTSCQTTDPTTSPTTSSTSSSSGSGNALGALALGGLAALALSQLGGGGLGGYGSGGYGDGLLPKERLYLQQATSY